VTVSQLLHEATRRLQLLTKDRDHFHFVIEYDDLCSKKQRVQSKYKDEKETQECMYVYNVEQIGTIDEGYLGANAKNRKPGHNLGFAIITRKQFTGRRSIAYLIMNDLESVRHRDDTDQLIVVVATLGRVNVRQYDPTNGRLMNHSPPSHIHESNNLTG
jgi:hypothetical protein